MLLSYISTHWDLLIEQWRSCFKVKNLYLIMSCLFSIISELSFGWDIHWDSDVHHYAHQSKPKTNIDQWVIYTQGKWGIEQHNHYSPSFLCSSLKWNLRNLIHNYKPQKMLKRLFVIPSLAALGIATLNLPAEY